MDPDRPPANICRGRPLFDAAILLGLAAGMEWPIVGILIAGNTLWVIALFGDQQLVGRRSAEIFSFGLIALWVARLV